MIGRCSLSLLWLSESQPFQESLPYSDQDSLGESRKSDLSSDATPSYLGTICQANSEKRGVFPVSETLRSLGIAGRTDRRPSHWRSRYYYVSDLSSLAKSRSPSGAPKLRLLRPVPAAVRSALSILFYTRFPGSCPSSSARDGGMLVPPSVVLSHERSMAALALSADSTAPILSSISSDMPQMTSFSSPFFPAVYSIHADTVRQASARE